MRLTSNLFFTSVLVLAVVAASLALPGVAQAQDEVSDYDSPGIPIGAPGNGLVTEGNGACTMYADRGTFDAAFPGLPVEDFEEGVIADGGVAGFPMPLDASTSNAIFSPGDILPGLQITATGGTAAQELVILGTGFNGNPSKQVIANTFVEASIVNFSPGVGATGMDLLSHFAADTLTVDIYGAGGLIESVNASGTNAGSFFGVSNCPEPITQIVINSPTNQAEGADNIAFGTGAPTTGTMGMILLVAILALGSMGILYRRRHA